MNDVPYYAAVLVALGGFVLFAYALKLVISVVLAILGTITRDKTN